MQYAPTTVVVPPNGKSATAWSGELTAEALERAIRISGRK